MKTVSASGWRARLSAMLALATTLALAAAPALAQDAAPPVVDKGDVAWMLVSTLLVLMMVVPGLALFYGGMVRAKNVLSVLIQVAVVFSLLVVLWVCYGYSLAFSGEGAWIGDFGKLFLRGVTPAPWPPPSAKAWPCRNTCSPPSRRPSPGSPGRWWWALSPSA